jgi:LPS O-antigen subunit length determinant protein (WzzB/FepE family)
MQQIQNDEIDLFQLFKTLWDGKWLISAFVAIAVLLGGGFLLLKEAVFESKLIYLVDTIPPFYNANKVSTDFQKRFYSVSVFKEWKQNNSNTSLVFEDYSSTEVVDGFVLSKKNGQLATLSENKGISFVLVKSNQLSILNDFFKYANYINVLLKDEYVVRAKEDLKIIGARFKNVGTTNSNVLDTLLSINRYIVTAEKGQNVFAIQRPTMPKKVSPKSSLTLIISAAFGGIFGVFFVLVRNAITKRKEQLAKA